MTAFGGVFRSPRLLGVENGDESGQGNAVLGLDLESGVLRVRPAGDAPVPPDPAADEVPADEADAEAPADEGSSES